MCNNYTEASIWLTFAQRLKNHDGNPFPEERKKREEGRQAPEPKKREEGTCKSCWGTPAETKRNQQSMMEQNPFPEERKKREDKHRNPSRNQEEPANHEGTKAVSSKNWEPHSAQDLFRGKMLRTPRLQRRTRHWEVDEQVMLCAHCSLMACAGNWVSQGISKLGTAQKELGSWKLSISRYLKVSPGISRYLKVSQGSERPKRSWGAGNWVSQGISRLGTAQKELGSWKLSISRYLKVSQSSERPKRSWGAGNWVSQGISRYLKVSQGISRYLKARNGPKGVYSLIYEVFIRTL